MSTPTFPYSIHLSTSSWNDENAFTNLSYEGTVDAADFKSNFITAVSDMFMINLSHDYEKPSGTPSSITMSNITSFFTPSFSMTTEEQAKFDNIISNMFPLMKTAFREADGSGTTILSSNSSSFNFEISTYTFMFRVNIGNN